MADAAAADAAAAATPAADSAAASDAAATPESTPAAAEEGGKKEEAPAASSGEAAAEQSAAADAAAASSSGAAPMEMDAPGAPAPEPKKVKKTIRHDVKFAASGVHGLSYDVLHAYFQQEHEMQKADRLQEETNEAKNTLEEYVYSSRSRISENASVSEDDKASALKELQDVEDWLYEDGEDTTKEIYLTRYDALRVKIGGFEGMSS
uniref:Uncharacterized protein n=1 Tax=Polytomella parva TaxID=51329 RepID=A0A7S0V3W5_9CHLO|mmetsp:Transcript_23921/g.42657  ORF Transcript_23921/g.42657 Transcript_23921/m.42657 type:complete len:207 (+) Transcript_23921:3-623(+)